MTRNRRIPDLAGLRGTLLAAAAVAYTVGFVVAVEAAPRKLVY